MSRVYARVEDGQIAELATFDTSPATLFHPAVRWMDVTGQNVAVGWREAVGGFVPPPPPEPAAPPSLADLQSQLAALAVKIAALGAS
jgi:hypothetical protein